MLLKSHLTEGILWFKQMSCLLTGRNQWGLPPLSLRSPFSSYLRSWTSSSLWSPKCVHSYNSQKSFLSFFLSLFLFLVQYTTRV